MITALKLMGAVLLFVGLVLRVANLGDRPMHHDESIHATFSFQWMEAPARAFYKYDPTYHGPFLYCITQLIFSLVGTGPAEARLFPLIFGLGNLALCFIFVRWIGWAGALASLALLLVSPLLTYYSRFLAHDMPAVFFGLIAAWATFRFWESLEKQDGAGIRQAYLVSAAAMGLLFSVKTVALLYGFIFLTFLGFAFAASRPPVPAEWKTPKRWGLPLLIGMGIFFCCYGIFQTSFFNNFPAVWDGLLGRNITYWWGQHNVERLKGPVTFHLRSLLLHELPLCLVIGVALVRRLMRQRIGKIGLWTLLATFVITVPMPWTLERGMPGPLLALLAIFKLKSSPDLFLYLMCFWFGIVGSYTYWKENRRFTAFLSYWTFASLAIYSYAGEKAPWLTVHTSFPATLLTGAILAPRLEALYRQLTAQDFKLSAMPHRAFTALLVLSLVYQVRLTYLVNFVKAGEPSDLLSQVHNHRDVKSVLEWMKRDAFEHGDKGEMPIALLGGVTWAFYFHLLEGGYKRYVLAAPSLTGKERFILTDDKLEKPVVDKLMAAGYAERKYTHAGWWVPEHNTLTWADWLDYAIYRRPKGSPGTTPLVVYYHPSPSVGAPATPVARDMAGHGIPR